MRDQIYRNSDKSGDFVFDDKVSSVFPDMIQRSIPGYSELVRFSAVWAKKQFSSHHELDQKSPVIVDLGASRGAVVFELLRYIGHTQPHIYAVDNSEAMMNLLKENVISSGYEKNVTTELADIADYQIPQHDLAIMHLTLQFIEKEKRLMVLKRIANNQADGGALLIAEKIKTNDRIIQLHEEFKRSMGYLDEEILLKRQALENVMLIDSEEEHIARFNEAGFTKIEKWFQCYNFVAWVLEK